MDFNSICRVLEGSELFKDLDQVNMKKIARLCEEETYGAGDYVFRQADLGEQIYIIVDGQIRLERYIDLGTRQGSAVIGLLGKGRVFGCWSSLLGQPHSLMSSAACQKPLRVLSINGSSLRDIMLQNRDLGFDILQKLCFLLRDRIQGAYGAMEKI